jgi:hypothetical protein
MQTHATSDEENARETITPGKTTHTMRNPRNRLQRKEPSKIQVLAKKLYAARTKARAESILDDMRELRPRDEYIEEIYLGLRDKHEFGWAPGTTTMADVRKLAKHYMKG